MKRVLLLVMFMSALFQGYSQTKGISYQAVILSPNAQEIPGVNAEGNILANSAVSIQFTIVNTSGSEEFQEYHTTRTDSYGMINLLIGNGTATSYNSFNDIVWDGTTKKLKVKIDFSGGTNFSPLSEQNLSYMPQPVSNETAQIINENATKIVDENTRAEAAEQANSDAINLKEDAANKSTDGTLATNSDVLFPTEKAVKTYVDAQSTSGSTELDAEIVRATAAEKLNNTAISDEVTRATAAEGILTTNISDEAIRAGLAEVANASNITLKEDAANKSTDGTLATNSDVLFPTEKAVKTYVDSSIITAIPDATTTVKGLIQLAGDLTGTAVSPIIGNNKVTTIKIADAAITDSKIATGISASKVGLGNVNNTSDANKPVSTATQTALDLKANIASPTLTGVPAAPTAAAATNTTQIATTAFVGDAVSTAVGASVADAINDGSTTVAPSQNAVFDALALKAPLASPTFTGTVSGITKSMVGLGNVDNTSDATKDAATSTLTNKTLTSPVINTPTGIVKGDVGLGNVDNTTDLLKPVSTATQTALDGKVDENAAITGATSTKITYDAKGLVTAGADATTSDIAEGTNLYYTEARVTESTAVAANTAKVTNATHTGDVTGAIALTIGDDKILEQHLKAVNAPTDEYVLSYEATTGDFEWQSSAMSIDGLSDGKTDASNLFLGQGAGLNDDGDNNNTGVGNGALIENTSGSLNAAFGKKALGSNTTGSLNTGFGGYALFRNTTGSHNTGFGINALYTNTTGNHNTGLGSYALTKNTEGLYNTAIGSNALLENTTGNNNTALGFQSLPLNTAGSDNTALGYRALYVNTTGIFNTATGGGALFQNTLGNHNTATGYKALELNTTGNDNTAIGYLAGSDITTGSNNTAIGKDAQIADPTADNQIQLGNTAITSVKTSGKLTTGAVTYPNTDGTASQFLTTDGSGYLSWATAGLTNFTETTYTNNFQVGVTLLAKNDNLGLVDLVLSPKGNGALLADQPDNSIPGGNNRGQNAIDLQKVRGNATQVASGNYSVILGGLSNTASGLNSSVVSGSNNTASGLTSFVGGGQSNTASGELSYVGGGLANIASEGGSSVVGGYANTSSGQYSSVVGGAENTASREYSFVGGGQSNTASGTSSLVGGGGLNYATSAYSFVGGGYRNTASGNYSSVGGGSGNTAQSYGETVLGLNATIGAGTATSYVATDRLFVIGNGTSDVAKSNALTILKNANTTIGGSLTVNGNGTSTSFALPAGRGTSGQVLTTDGAGVTNWASASAAPTYTIGLRPELGGYVFWVSSDGKHGLVAETIDQGNVTWYEAQNAISNPLNHSTDGKNFRDWRFPTKFELNEMYINRVVIGNFLDGNYWSSTEFSDINAWHQFFYSGYPNNGPKSNLYNVRAVRAF